MDCIKEIRGYWKLKETTLCRELSLEEAMKLL